jgi:hypothetical protein
VAGIRTKKLIWFNIFREKRMFEDQSEQEVSSMTTVRIAMAMIFIVLAIPLGLWVLSIVNTSIHDTNMPAIVEKIVPAMGISCDINTPAGKFELPKPMFAGMSYFILYLFLLIPTGIAIALIKGSVALLNPDLKRQLRQLTESIRKSTAPKQ